MAQSCVGTFYMYLMETGPHIEAGWLDSHMNDMHLPKKTFWKVKYFGVMGQLSGCSETTLREQLLQLSTYLY